jgi:hypothetical protein
MHTIPQTTPRRQLRQILEDSLYLPRCKSCNFPLAPRQQETGLCGLCERQLSGIAEGRPDWDHNCNNVEGYRG